jgi:hypothetical protein
MTIPLLAPYGASRDEPMLTAANRQVTPLAFMSEENDDTSANKLVHLLLFYHTASSICINIA